MTKDELRAAAERVRSAGVNIGNARIEDRNLIVTAYLAEHPSDDDDPVTKEWYESVGGRYADDGTYSIDLPYREVSLVFYPKGVTASHPQVWLWVPSGVVVSVNNTRGHVRRLCAALGAPLKETK